MTKKIIGIDMSSTEVEHVTGIGRHTIEILNRIVRFDRDIDFILFGYADSIQNNELNSILELENCRRIGVGRYYVKSKFQTILRDQVQLPAAMFKSKCSYVWYPFVNVPLVSPRYIVTIHDLSQYRNDIYFSSYSRLYYKALIFFAVKFSKHILTVSETSRSEIIERFSVQKRKITVTYNGVSLSGSEEQIYNDSLELSYDYFLYSGGLGRRKNIINMIKAFQLVRSNFSSDIKLLITGNYADHLYLDDYVADSGRYGIKFLGYVSNAELSELYSSALIVYYLSIYEGFGLPILEAQSYGVPVVVSNSSCLPEIAGKGSICVDPKNLDDIAKETINLITDKKKYEKIKKDGYYNIKRFSWDDSAKIIRKFLVNPL
jgi:glycosyltransferase involved in cell wall biosynthesis